MNRLPYQSLTVILMLLMFAACSDGTPDAEPHRADLVRPAKIVPLMQNDTGMRRTYPGTLEASLKADLAFRVSGQLMELPAIAGLEVKKGDLLAQLDPTDFNNTLAERQARFDLARTQFEQAEKLFKKKISSQLQYDQANAELKSARAALQQARDNLRYTRLTAPFDGIVARVEIENFQPAQAQVAIIQLRNFEELAIRFSVPESMPAQLRREEDPEVLKSFCGQVRFLTHPNQRFRACYREHESVPDPITRNYSALFTLDKISEFEALPGMTASIELDFSDFLAERDDQSVFAPVEALLQENGKQWLWLVDKELRARKLEVSVGRIEGDRIEITSEIDPQSSIIAAGVSYVREGMQVKPMVKQRGL
jgi:RND family efflux transporter MFP subunit